jgi:ParB-like chromosome segregation protein Spo0J
MSTFKSPVYGVIPVPLDKLRSNKYNPNRTAPPEMKLLELSIWEDGFTMPIVCSYIEKEDVYEIIDGFHRWQTALTSERIRVREGGVVPVVVLKKETADRMASTIRHNRARGVHEIDLMCKLVAELKGAGMSDAWVLDNLGMDADELLRLKQITGLADLFKDKDFSKAWEAGEP